MLENNLEFGTELIKILDIYTENSWRNEPLDSDEVDREAEIEEVVPDKQEDVLEIHFNALGIVLVV